MASGTLDTVETGGAGDLRFCTPGRTRCLSVRSLGIPGVAASRSEPCVRAHPTVSFREKKSIEIFLNALTLLSRWLKREQEEKTSRRPNLWQSME